MYASALSIYPAVQISFAASDEKGLGSRAKGPDLLGAGAGALMGAGAGALLMCAGAGAMRGAKTGAQTGAMLGATSPGRPPAARDTATSSPLVVSIGCWIACNSMHAAIRLLQLSYAFLSKEPWRLKLTLFDPQHASQMCKTPF